MSQTFRFDTANEDSLTIAETAEALSVSSASVRNWVKTGYLATNNNRRITRESFEGFRDHVAGVAKLTTRTNKSLTDDHDHPALQARFTEELELKGDVTGDYLSDEYEAGLSNSYRNKEGIYYTPSDIAGKFFKHLPEDRAQLTFCDPCCGTGNFLIEALGNGFHRRPRPSGPSGAIRTKGDVTGDYLSDEYEAGLSNSYRNKEGIYYTPSDIAGKFFKHLDRAQLTFCDPCSTGNFLIELGNGFSVANVYGFDTDGTAVEIAKRRIYEKTGMDSPNVRTEDFLRLVAERPKESGSYDVVLTNPPWGKKFDKKDKEFFAFKLGGRPTNDASALFFLAATRVVNTRGYLGMLLPDAFFNVTAFKDVRDKVLSYRLLSVTDFGRPFRALLTKAKGLLVQMDKPAENDLVACDTPSGQHKRPQQSFIANPKSILNFALSPSGADAISHLLAVPHRTLAGNARWRLGVLGVK